MSRIKTGDSKRLSPSSGMIGTRPKSLPDGVQERLACKAYELWEMRGSRHGYAMQDWLDAEALLMDEIHETRK